MSAYIHGSLALEERKTPAGSARRAEPQAKSAHRAKTMAGTDKLLWIGLALLTFAILGFYQYREAHKYELNAEMIKIEKEIRALEEQNALLRNEAAKLGNPERLIETGIMLGLVPQSDLPAASNEGVAVASVR